FPRFGHGSLRLGVLFNDPTDPKWAGDCAMSRYSMPIVATLIAVSSYLVPILHADGAWDHVHGDSANTGFARVSTLPARSPLRDVPLGRLAFGAGPVIGPNGMLYVGNLDNQMLTLQPDGTIASKSDIEPRGAFLASPVVGADGSVYWAKVRQEQARDPHGTEFTRYDSTLNKRTADNSTGLWFVHLPVAPVDPPPSPALAGWPVAAAPPSMWRFGTTEVVVMPVLDRYPSAAELRLLAFSTQSGTVLGNKIVSSKVFDVTGSGPDLSDREWCLLAMAFGKPQLIDLCLWPGYYSPHLGQC